MRWVLVLLLLAPLAAAEPSLHVVYPEESFFDDDGTPLIPVRPGNAFSLEVEVLDEGMPVKNARVVFENLDGDTHAAWTNSQGVAARGQYAGSGEAVWNIRVAVECVLNADGDCVAVEAEAKTVRLAWTSIRIDLHAPQSVAAGSNATLNATATWTATGTSAPEGRILFLADGYREHAFIVDGRAIQRISREAGSVEVAATMEAADRPAAVPVIPSDPVTIQFQASGGSGGGGSGVGGSGGSGDGSSQGEEPTAEPVSAPRPRDSQRVHSSDPPPAEDPPEADEDATGNSSNTHDTPAPVALVALLLALLRRR